MSLSQADFEMIRSLVLKRAAIVLEEEKVYLAEARMSNLARREGLGSVAALMEKLHNDRGNGLVQKIVEAMTTNETSFFRDIHPWEALRLTVLPQVLQRRQQERRLNIWCAAASSGQEPYTVAMLLRENFPQLSTWTLSFVASDLSTEMLQRCREGRYNQMEVNRGLSARLLVKYFTRAGADWVVNADLRRLIEFRQVNLIEPWIGLPQMDIVLIRNVLIYFDIPTKRQILGKIRQLLRPDGYLFLGGAETTLNLDDNFERMNSDRSGCYQLRKR